MTGRHFRLFVAIAAASLATQAPVGAQSVEAGAARPELTGRIVWTRKPTGDVISETRPERVVRERVAGGAMLDCLATSAGSLTDCKVAAEAPLGYGFGAAAQRLAGQYRLAAKTDAGEPTAGARLRLPVTFNAGRVGGAMTLMAYPIWVEAPSVAEVEAAYPTAAEDVSGAAVVRCAFDIRGRTTDCAVRSEKPAGKGFGPAALALADRFVVVHEEDDAAILPGVIADIPISFRKPGAAGGSLPEPQWLNALAPAAAEAFFPEAAREAKVTSGVGTVDCLVASGGRLSDCRVTSERPENLGFGDAALQSSKLLVLNPWTEKGEPYAGRRLSVPIRLRLVNPRLEGKPTWLSQPSAKDIADLRPRGNGKARMAGGAVLNCVVGDTGLLAGCTIEDESPKGFDFGAAVLETAPLFRMAPKTERGLTTAGTRVKVPVNFPAEP